MGHLRELDCEAKPQHAFAEQARESARRKI
jgi:hypothetical protein